jgi:hypothetical protein
VLVVGLGAALGAGFDNRLGRALERPRLLEVPPLEGPDRKRFVERMQIDYQDFAMLGDAAGSVEDGFLVLRVDLRPDEAR